MARQRRPDRLPPGPAGVRAARRGVRAVPAPGGPADDGDRDTGTSAIMNAVPHEAVPHDAAPLGQASAGEVLNRYLYEHAAGFLRGLGLRGERAAEADVLLRASARRIGGALHTFGALTDPAWSEPLRVELAWLAGTLGREPQHAGRLARLLDALHRLEGGTELALGAARAGALLERQLTLARTRAHSASLQAVGSARFHALADAVAVLASEVPLAPAAAAPAADVLPPLADQAFRRLSDAAAALPLHRAAHPYNAEAVQASLGADLAADLQDAPWHQVRVLLRLSRYATEVLGPRSPHLTEAADLLDLHREAAESASAVAAAARTPRIAPSTAYALGVLHADQRHEVEAARFAFSHVWPSAIPTA